VSREKLVMVVFQLCLYSVSWYFKWLSGKKLFILESMIISLIPSHKPQVAWVSLSVFCEIWMHMIYLDLHKKVHFLFFLHISDMEGLPSYDYLVPSVKVEFDLMLGSWKTINDKLCVQLQYVLITLWLIILLV
jgi:hypothetical protein